MPEPLISVVIPLYNKEKIVERTISSILKQDFATFEVVVVDDGSTDASLSVVRGIKDDRVRIVEQPNAGPSAARNTGVKNARGKWIAFLDADDQFTKGALSAFYDVLKEHKDVNFVFGETLVFTRNKYLKSTDYKTCQIIKNPFKSHFFGTIAPRTGNVLMTRELALKCPFNGKLRRYEDVDWLFKVYKESKMIAIPRIQMRLNYQFSSASAARKDVNEDFVSQIDIKTGSLWQRLAAYKLFFEEHMYYDEQLRVLRPELYRAHLLYFLCILRGRLCKKKEHIVSNEIVGKLCLV